MKRLFLLICLFLSAQLFANYGGGTDGNIGTGHLKLIGTSQIEILNENLEIELYQKRAKVKVEYIMKNTGNPITVQAGFPSLGKEIEDYVLKANETIEKHTIQEGEKYKLYEEEVGEFENPQFKWFISKIPFNKSEEKKITITYESVYEEYEGGTTGHTSTGPNKFRYLLSTAKVWKGPIQKGKVSLKFMTVSPKDIIIKPAGRFKEVQNTANGKSFVWKFENLKPSEKDDLLIDFNNNYESFYDVRGEMKDFYIKDKTVYYLVTTNYSVKASSTLKAGKISYDAENVKNQDKMLTWSEGKEDDGINEYLELMLKKPNPINKIQIVPGYAKSKALYYANNRVSDLEIIINNEHRLNQHLPDDFCFFHTIDLGSYSQPVKSIKLVIKGVYKGSKYSDTCINKVRLLKRIEGEPKINSGR